MITTEIDQLKTSNFEIVTLQELKTFCRISNNFEDDTILEFRETAVDLIERTYLISIYKKRLEAVYRAPKSRTDVFQVLTTITDPDNISKKIRLPYRPFVSIEKVELIHKNGTKTDFTDYTFLPYSGSNEIIINNNYQLLDECVMFIAVTYLTGFDEDKVPSEIKSAIKYLVLNLYEKDDSSATITSKVGDLLSKYKSNTFYDS